MTLALPNTRPGFRRSMSLTVFLVFPKKPYTTLNWECCSRLWECITLYLVGRPSSDRNTKQRVCPNFRVFYAQVPHEADAERRSEDLLFSSTQTKIRQTVALGLLAKRNELQPISHSTPGNRTKSTTLPKTHIPVSDTYVLSLSANTIVEALASLGIEGGVLH